MYEEPQDYRGLAGLMSELLGCNVSGANSNLLLFVARQLADVPRTNGVELFSESECP